LQISIAPANMASRKNHVTSSFDEVIAEFAWKTITRRRQPLGGWR
jgi:hypothetical protein